MCLKVYDTDFKTICSDKLLSESKDQATIYMS